MYISWNTSFEMPNLQLAGFDRIFIKARSSQQFKFVIGPDQLAVWTDIGYVVKPGMYTYLVLKEVYQVF